MKYSKKEFFNLFKKYIKVKKLAWHIEIYFHEFIEWIEEYEKLEKL